MTRTNAAVAILLVLLGAAVAVLLDDRLADTDPPVTAAGKARRPAGTTRPREASVAEDRGRVAVKPADEPLAEVRGSLPGTKLGLLALRRGGSGVLVVSVRLTTARSADREGLQKLWAELSRGLVAGNVSAMELRDAATSKASLPETHGYTRCDCSTIDAIRPAATVDLGATFKLPDAGGPFVLRVPGFPEIAGIEPAGP